MSTFKVGDLVVFLTEIGIRRVITVEWSEERCLESICMIIEEDIMPNRFSSDFRPVFRILMISGLQTRIVNVPEKELFLLATAT